MESSASSGDGSPLRPFLYGALTGSILTGIGLFLVKKRKHGPPGHSGHGHNKGSTDGESGCCPD